MKDLYFLTGETRFGCFQQVVNSKEHAVKLCLDALDPDNKYSQMVNCHVLHFVNGKLVHDEVIDNEIYSYYPDLVCNVDSCEFVVDDLPF